jgi:large subunit ribosomal protein L19
MWVDVKMYRIGNCRLDFERVGTVCIPLADYTHHTPTAMLSKCLRTPVRLMSTSLPSYPYSNIAIIPPSPPAVPLDRLRKGKGLMAYLQQTLPTTHKQQLLSTLFSRRHPDRLVPGSILTVTLTHAPTTFSGVLISLRRRGPDTSFVLRNVVQRTGVEMQFFVNSPHLQEIQVVRRPGMGTEKRIKHAKLFYLRDYPGKMTAASVGVRA